MSLFETSPDCLAAALDIDIPSGVWTPWSPLGDSQDLARSLLPYGHLDASLKTGPISCWDTAAVADSHGDMADITQDPMALSGATHSLVRALVDGHTTGAAHDLQDTSPMAYFDPRISASPQSTGDNASLALLATIGAFGTPPDMSRTAPILTADVLALSLTGVIAVMAWMLSPNAGKKEAPRTQCTSFALELLTYGGLRSHAIGAFITNTSIELLYYDRTIIVKSEPFDFAQHPARFMSIEYARRCRKPHHESMGISSSFEHTELHRTCLWTSLYLVLLRLISIDLESLFYVIVYIVYQYHEGNKIDNPPFDAWDHLPTPTLRTEKVTFLESQ
ncbi:hypothetical protein C8J57DRAFT_1719047 [Mycena rebaudengoi]|nr:hypothetical protein C8J57DRAFT_1719047 [Mycena rebaudengoi]